MIATPEFQNWHKAEVARRLGLASQIDEVVDRMMQPQNLKIEEF